MAVIAITWTVHLIFNMKIQKSGSWQYWTRHQRDYPGYLDSEQSMELSLRWSYAVIRGYLKDEKLVDKATNRNPNAPEFSELTRWSAAAFLEDTWSITDHFDLTAGLRYDHDENYSGHLSPRLYGVYTVNDNFVVKVVWPQVINSLIFVQPQRVL